jgi:hypothetical protein
MDQITSSEKITALVNVLVVNQLDVTILISLFTLYMLRTILVHHQEFCYVRYAGLTKVCGALVWYPLCVTLRQYCARTYPIGPHNGYHTNAPHTFVKPACRT